MGAVEERLRAVARLLTESGDISPMGARVLSQVADDMDGSTARAPYALTPAEVAELWRATGRARFPVLVGDPEAEPRTVAMPLAEDVHVVEFARALGVVVDEDGGPVEPLQVATVRVRTRSPEAFLLLDLRDGSRWGIRPFHEGWAWRRVPSTDVPAAIAERAREHAEAVHEPRGRTELVVLVDAFVAGAAWAAEEMSRGRW